MMKYVVVGMLSLVSTVGFSQIGLFNVQSPDSNIGISLSVSDKIYYSVTYKHNKVVDASVIALHLEDRVVGDHPVVSGSDMSQHSGVINLPYGNTSTLDDTYNALVVNFQGDYALELRAYNDGVSYRFVTKIKSPVIVRNEDVNVNFASDFKVQFPESENFTSWELPYINYTSISKIPVGKKAVTPVLFTNNELSVIIAESDVVAYPGMYLMKHENGFSGKWAPYPKKTELGSWGNFVSVVKETEDFIARTDGDRTFPWRIIIVTDDAKSLLTNDIVYKLARPTAIKDVSWVRPGKATWEWWHDAIVEDAGIPSGMKNRNTALYKHYIDFAAANHLEYLMLDAGWSNIFDLAKINEKNDIHELILYGKKRNVDLFLWCVATTLIADLDRSMDLMKDWGVAGLKVDFFDRDDQESMKWMERIAAAAAKRKLMVNFHGCTKPTGLERAYPNIVNYEAVRGAECSKWDRTANPDHHVTVLFSRMIAGPLDYTPGSMRNANQEQFKPVDPGLPSTQGTRCHELSMYVLFDQPFAMLCDAPTEYRKYPDIMKYLSAVPTSFDETRVLQADVNEFAVMAKRKGNSWFVGAMTNWAERDVIVSFDFLPKGKKLKAEFYHDAAEANTDASHYKHETIEVSNTTKLKVHLAKGGGAVVYLHP